MSDNRRFNRFAQPGGSALNTSFDEADSLAAADREIFGTEMPASRALVAPPPDALVNRGDGTFAYKRFVMTPVGMEIPADATDDELKEVGAILGHLGDWVQWNSADWFNRAENRVWGQMYQPSVENQRKYQTLADYAWVARHVQFSIRNRKLTFSHHRVVAPLHETPALQKLWLEYTVSRQSYLRVEDMKREIRALEMRPVENQTEWLEWAIPQPDMLLSELPEFERPALLPPPHLPAHLLEARKYIGRSFNRFKSYTQGNLSLSRADLEREGRAIIEWVQRVMDAQ